MKKALLFPLWLWLVATAAAGEPISRPAHWAQPLEVDGVSNLYKVSEVLYRSAQPTAGGIANLRKLGIRTVVNLRTFHSDEELLAGTGLGYVSIPMQAWYPETKDAVAFLGIVTDTARTPVLVHCQHGADRTGAMVAVYRAAIQGWTKKEAVREMVDGGFGHHRVWRNLPAWFYRLDLKKLRQRAGMEPSP